MRRLIARTLGSALAGISMLALLGSHARADECGCPTSRGMYVGIFGGGGGQDIDGVRQTGTAFFTEAQGGPLAVNAFDNPGSRGVGLIGLQIGYEGSGRAMGGEGSGWALLPAVEFEGFWLGGATQRANVIDPNNRLNGHVFADTFPVDSGVFLLNAVLSVQTPSSSLTPYIGVGMGTANISINGADSPQVIPPEPGVNHFNSNPDADDWGFAALIKFGVRFNLSERWYVFTEYRLLYVGSTEYEFGSTVAPGHVATTPWNVQFGDTIHHLGVAGIGFSF
jgi:opacity protein-like surface antigen